ncbi:MAG: glutamine cyclotransferase [Halioglobus sp.]
MNSPDRRSTQLKLALLLPIVSLLVLAACTRADVAQYAYKVTGKIPQPRENFVQGLQILDGHLYVSTGNYGESKLLRYRLSDGKLLAGRNVDKRLFAEGLTVLGDRIFQLTWRSHLVLIYNKEDLKGLEYFRIPGEGWGLTNNGSDLIYSDGSHRLHYLSPKTKSITRTISVTESGNPVTMLNELEWINGERWANIWQQNRIIMINPDTGNVTGSVNLQGLLPGEEKLPGTDVLNGIAFNPQDNTVWVTGKRWPWLYQIELISTRAQR